VTPTLRPAAETSRDDNLTRRLELALIDIQPLNPLALPKVCATADGGHVTLYGNVATASQAASIARAVSALPGIRTLCNELVDDGNLTLDVWFALTRVPELCGADRRLRVVFGTVYVDWAVRSPSLEALTDRVLDGLPGVRQVVHGEWPDEEYRRARVA
jgi:hypothetical protein